MQLKGGAMYKLRRRSVAAFALAGSIVMLSGDLAATAGAKSEQKTIRIGLVLPALSNPFINPVKTGAEAEAKKIGNVKILTTGINTPAEQANALKTYIAGGVDALVFDSIDSAAVSPAVIEANKKGIPVIGVISGAKSGKLATFISPKWYQAGFDVGKQIATGYCRRFNPCRVGLVGGANAPGAGLDSGKGMMAGVKSAKNVDLVQTVYTDYSAEQSLAAAQQILTAHPDLNFLMSWWSVGTISVVSSIRTANKTGKIGAASISGACPVLKDMLDGKVYADAAMFSELMGSAAVQSAIKAIKGEKLPKNQASPYYLITRPKALALLSGKAKAPKGVPIVGHLKAAKAGCK
jgi:ribose transport system substrate-binding protein